MARLAMTSFMFMLALVPAPHCMLSTMNSLSNMPQTTSLHADSMALAISGFNLPAFRLVMAAARFIFARFLMKTGCNRVPVIGKFSFARKACTP